MARNRKTYLLKNTIIFIIGNLGSKFISFFLIPLYTNALTTAQYGTVDLISTICNVAVPIFTLNVCEAVIRFSLDKDVNREKITQIGTLVLLGSLILGVILIPICGRISEVSNYSILVYFYTFSFASSLLYLCDLRGKELLLQYSIGNILNTFLLAVLNILFLLYFHLGTEGFLLAYIGANTVTAIYAIIVGKGYRSFKITGIDKYKMIEMLKYSSILIPTSFMWWIMNSSDRIMITMIKGVAVNGIYSISYKIPTLVSSFTNVINQAWSYSAIDEDEASDVQEYTNNTFRTMISFTILLGIVLLMIMKPFLKIYVTEAFFEAWKYTPFLLIGCIYFTLGLFMATSYTVHKDSKGYLLSSMIGAFINIALNFILIPQIGAYGAAIATCVSYVIYFFFVLLHTRKYMRYEIINREFLLGNILLVLASIVMFFIEKRGIIFQFIIVLIALYVYKNFLTGLIRMVKKILKK